MVRHILFTVILLSSILKTYAQDPSFSQIENTGSLVHPSKVDFTKGFEFGLANRRQWANIDQGFITYTANVNVNFEQFGLGVCLLQDNEGAGRLNTFSGRISFNFMFNLMQKKNKRMLIVSPFATINRKSINWDKLVFSDQIDPSMGITKTQSEINPPSENSFYSDLGFSFTYIDHKLLGKKNTVTLSYSYYNVIHPSNASLYGVENGETPGRYGVALSLLFPLLKYSLQFDSQSQLRKITTGAMFKLTPATSDNKFYFGSNFLSGYYPLGNYNYHTNSLAPQIEYDTENFTSGISYDFNVSGLKRGAFEIAILIHEGDPLKWKKFKRKLKKIIKSCPGF